MSKSQGTLCRFTCLFRFLMTGRITCLFTTPLTWPLCFTSTPLTSGYLWSYSGSLAHLLCSSLIFLRCFALSSASCVVAIAGVFTRGGQNCSGERLNAHSSPHSYKLTAVHTWADYDQIGTCMGTGMQKAPQKRDNDL